MTMIQLNISDDLKEAFDKAFPGETIEQVVERLLRAEVGRRPPPAPSEVEAYMERIRRIRESGPAIADDEIWKLRQEGRP